jgi:hypothetical protein
LPSWPHSQSWGFFPSGIVGVIVIVLIILLVMGGISRTPQALRLIRVIDADQALARHRDTTRRRQACESLGFRDSATPLLIHDAKPVDGHCARCS